MELKEGLMGGEIHKCAVVGANNSHTGDSIDVPRIAAAINDKAGNVASLPVANPVAERLARLPGKIEEEDDWSPTQLEIDTYINSLEQELLQSCEDMQDRPGNRYKGAAPVKARPSNSFILLWGLVTIEAGCLWGLARIILKALN
jgi:hypothetical protein